MEHRVMPIGKMKNPIVMNPMSMIMPIMISILLLVISIFVKFECFLCDFVILVEEYGVFFAGRERRIFFPAILLSQFSNSFYFFLI